VYRPNHFLRRMRLSVIFVWIFRVRHEQLFTCVDWLLSAKFMQCRMLWQNKTAKTVNSGTCLVLHKLEADHQTLSTDIAHAPKLVTKSWQFFQKIAANYLRRFLTAVFFNDLQQFHHKVLHQRACMHKVKFTSNLLRKLNKTSLWKIGKHILTSRTMEPTVHARGFPPNVLMWRACCNDLAISGVVTTAAIGNPLPIDFAIVTETIQL